MGLSARRRYALIALLLSIFAGIVTAFATVNGLTRVSTVLVLYFSGFAGGAGLTSFIWRRGG